MSAVDLAAFGGAVNRLAGFGRPVGPTLVVVAAIAFGGLGVAGCSDGKTPAAVADVPVATSGDPVVPAEASFAGEKGRSAFLSAANTVCSAALEGTRPFEAIDGARDRRAWATSAVGSAGRLTSAVARLAQQRPESARDLLLVRRQLDQQTPLIGLVARGESVDPVAIRDALDAGHRVATQAGVPACALS